MTSPVSILNPFDEKLHQAGKNLKKSRIEVLQVNVGKYCNLACQHCHVEAGPRRKEMMDEPTAQAVVRFLAQSSIPTLDLTGGAPELNPHFRYLVEQARLLGRHVMDRCNLTVFYEPGMDGLPEFLAQHQVEIVASLPCYSRENVDKQRGKGTFDASIEALIWLNSLGYGKERTGLVLNLVYNPVGPHLPPAQDRLQQDYKEILWEDFKIVFNKLYAITNMPITRYAAHLRAKGKYEDYMNLLINSFNPQTVEGLMCVNTLSVSYDGRLYDCDFNQALGMNLNNGSSRQTMTIFDLTPEDLEDRPILTADHCFGCTAGRGSSCGGMVA